MNLIFFVDDDGRNQAYLNAMQEENHQRRGICYLCSSECADTWIRNLSSRTPQGMYSEYLVGPKCRDVYGVQMPIGYSTFSLMGNMFESMPYIKDNNCYVANDGDGKDV